MGSIDRTSAFIRSASHARRHLRRAAALLVGAGVLAQAGAADETAADARLLRTLQLAGTEVRLELEDTNFRYGHEQIVGWIERSVAAVTAYYGRFPVSPVRIRVEPGAGRRVGSGQAFGGSPPFVRIEVGREVMAEQLQEDWVAVHEMVHLALPEVGRRHIWLSEGLSTYVEGIARVQSGGRRAEQVWAEFVRAMPQGLPRSGDEGLDNTHTWGRTYWGGALFCLQADVEIRRRTGNRYGLQDALRAVLQASGGIAGDWPIERVMQAGDRAVGGTVLQDLYTKWKDAPVTPDLAALWRDLGIHVSEAGLELRADAPLAATREAIMGKRCCEAKQEPAAR